MDELTNEKIAEMADAALQAAKKKAEEFGLPWIAGYLGIMLAERTVSQMMDLYMVLGPDVMNELGRAIEKSEMYDMQQQAEDTLKGEWPNG